MRRRQQGEKEIEGRGGFALGSQAATKNLGVAAHICVTGAGRWRPKEHWPASLSERESFRFSERAYLK